MHPRYRPQSLGVLCCPGTSRLTLVRPQGTGWVCRCVRARGSQGTTGPHCLSQQHPRSPQPTELFFVHLVHEISASVNTFTEKMPGPAVPFLLWGQIACSPMFCRRNAFQLCKTITVGTHTAFSHALKIQESFARQLDAELVP